MRDPFRNEAYSNPCRLPDLLLSRQTQFPTASLLHLRSKDLEKAYSLSGDRCLYPLGYRAKESLDSRLRWDSNPRLGGFSDKLSQLASYGTEGNRTPAGRLTVSCTSRYTTAPWFLSTNYPKKYLFLFDPNT